MQTAADEASDLLKALASRHRLLILCQLIDGERSVGQLADFLEIRPSTVSQHLAVLRRDRIVAARREGQTIWYRIESDPAREVITVLYGAFCAQKEGGTPARPGC
jgi:DNA-binding transcriptional ArsR family regulator